jgi:hypothetical protein
MGGEAATPVLDATGGGTLEGGDFAVTSGTGAGAGGDLRRRKLGAFVFPGAFGSSPVATSVELEGAVSLAIGGP